MFLILATNMLFRKGIMNYRPFLDIIKTMSTDAAIESRFQNCLVCWLHLLQFPKRETQSFRCCHVNARQVHQSWKICFALASLIKYVIKLQ